jgi:hypothetical protein
LLTGGEVKGKSEETFPQVKLLIILNLFAHQWMLTGCGKHRKSFGKRGFPGVEIDLKWG